MHLYHSTSTREIDAIRRDGLRDGYNSQLPEGVWFSDEPVQDGLYLFRIEVTEDQAAEFEVVTEGAPYREFIVPASVANLTLVEIEEYD